MVGLCGVVRGRVEDVELIAESLPNGSTPSTRDAVSVDQDIAVCVRSHGIQNEAQPVEVEDGVSLWLWGQVYGIHDPTDEDGYRSLDESDLTSPVGYCARLFDEHGMEFISRLNGEFVGVLHDRTTGTVHLFTDRIGTTPLFYTTTPAGRLVFSTQIQSLAACDDVAVEFDTGYLCEYLSIMKTFGTKTPLVDVEKVPPASVLSFDEDTLEPTVDTYWIPVFDPLDEPFEYFGDEFTRLFVEVVRDRTRLDRRYGLMLSGGSDSRLVLAALRSLDRDVTCYHLANWMSREARTAERVALAADSAFELLRRGDSSHEQLLAETPAISNFVGSFDEAFAHGFVDDLSGEVDTVITGYLGDTMFGGYTLYPRKLSVGSFDLGLPVETPVRTPAAYIEKYTNRGSYSGRAPSYFHGVDLLEVLRGEIYDSDGGIVHHGVWYPSIRELQLCEYYPLTNQFASFNHLGLQQIAPHWTPFFDHRLIDLHLQMPVKYQLRRNLVNAAVARLDSELAAIPHGYTGLPLTISFPLDYAIEKATRLIQRIRPQPTSSAPYASHSPWMNEQWVIRQTDLIETVIDDGRSVIDALPFLDEDEIERTYRAHLDGANHWLILYTLATFLEMPMTKDVAKAKVEDYVSEG